MSVLQINSFNHGSTGNIMIELRNEMIKKGIESYVSVPNSKSNQAFEIDTDPIYIGNRLDRNIHNTFSRINGKGGEYSKLVTLNLIKKIEKMHIKVVHLHNLHDSYINLKLLFSFFKKKNIEVIWTLHDCWAFTGGCTHFTSVNCLKWQNECNNCPLHKNFYPKSLIDNTKKMYNIKKKYFSELENMTIVVPSHWLKGVVEKSFLKKYKIKVINNGIDLEVFNKRKISKEFLSLHKGKKIILGVSSIWNERKGLYKFINLAKRLDSRTYQVILVGLTKSQIENLPKEIIGIERTNSLDKLSELYSLADLFVNASLEETAGLVTLEALACGTPVLVADSTALKEYTSKETSLIVKNGTVDEFYNAITKYFEIDSKNFNEFDCIKRAKKFSKINMREKYIDLYLEKLSNYNV